MHVEYLFEQDNLGIEQYRILQMFEKDLENKHLTATAPEGDLACSVVATILSGSDKHVLPVQFRVRFENTRIDQNIGTMFHIDRSKFTKGGHLVPDVLEEIKHLFVRRYPCEYSDKIRNGRVGV